MAVKKQVLQVSGMTCAHCEKRIETAVSKLKGVQLVSASFPKKQVQLRYDEAMTNVAIIKEAIEAEGYRVLGEGQKKHPFGKVVPVFLIVIALYFILRYTVGFDFINIIPKIDSTVSLITLFATGLLTSVHCVAMCGGINLSQSVGSAEDTADRFKKPLLYNLGRVISYTVVGAAVGGIGSVLFVSTAVKGVIMLIAAVFMILMSLSMLGWLPWWLVPRLPAGLSKQASRMKKDKAPLVVGLFNGLLPCGPLQAMQLYALSTGSVFSGALSMLIFSLGTVPLMLGLGFAFTALKGRFTRGITRLSAVLVMMIGFYMVLNAGSLFGFNTDGGASQTAQTGEKPSQSAGASAAPNSEYTVATLKDGVQVVEAELKPSKYPFIQVQKGIPVRFNIKAKQSVINGCNGTVVFPGFDIEKELKAGDNIIEFTPQKTGTIGYTCWMGMIRGKISVVDAINNNTAANAQGQASAAAPSAQPSQSDGAAIGGCCSDAAKAARFAGGKVPVDDISVAQIINGKQILTVKVSDAGYSPAAFVVQKGVETKIRFVAEKLNACNPIVVFPEYEAGIDLPSGELETPFLKPGKDFTFECGMGMLHGYVKVVDDIAKIDLNKIKSEISAYQPQTGGGCCG